MRVRAPARLHVRAAIGPHDLADKGEIAVYLFKFRLRIYVICPKDLADEGVDDGAELGALPPVRSLEHQARRPHPIYIYICMYMYE